MSDTQNPFSGVPFGTIQGSQLNVDTSQLSAAQFAAQRQQTQQLLAMSAASKMPMGDKIQFSGEAIQQRGLQGVTQETPKPRGFFGRLFDSYQSAGMWLLLPSMPSLIVMARDFLRTKGWLGVKPILETGANSGIDLVRGTQDIQGSWLRKGFYQVARWGNKAHAAIERAGSWIGKQVMGSSLKTKLMNINLGALAKGQTLGKALGFLSQLKWVRSIMPVATLIGELGFGIFTGPIGWVALAAGVGLFALKGLGRWFSSSNPQTPPQYNTALAGAGGGVQFASNNGSFMQANA